MRREHILDYVYREFARLGIRKVGVDDIAAGLHMSKKTLYELFSNKEKLLLSALEHEFGKVIEAFNAFSNENVLSIIVKSSVRLFNTVNVPNPHFYEELISHPAAAEFVGKMKEGLLERGRCRFQQGIDEGYLRGDADYEIVGRLLNNQIMEMRQTRSDKYTPVQICYYSLIIILRGVCTAKGVEMLDSLHNSEFEELC